MTALKGSTYHLGDSDFSSIDLTEFVQHKEIIKNLPLEERPREKLIAYGAGALTDGELLAILLRTGTASKSALTLGRELTRDGGLYKRLARISRVEELTEIRGLGQAKAATVLAAMSESDNTHPTISCVHASVTRCRYTTPSSVSIYVMSATQSLHGRSTTSPFVKFLYLW